MAEEKNKDDSKVENTSSEKKEKVKAVNATSEEKKPEKEGAEKKKSEAKPEKEGAEKKKSEAKPEKEGAEKKKSEAKPEKEGTEEKKTDSKRAEKKAEPEKSKGFQVFAYIVILLLYFALIIGVSVLMFKCDTSEDEMKEGELCKEKHVYKSETGNICQVCGYEYVPEIKDMNKTMVAAKNGVKVRSFYYSDDANIVYRLNEGDEVTVTGEFKNSVGSSWYITDEGYYIFSDNLKAAE